MNLLNEGIKTGAVVKTELTKKFSIDGTTQVFPVYRIRLDLLYFNDQNNRITTWLSQYRAEHNGELPSIADKENFNAIIEDYIIKSNPEAIKRTETNIELVDQREAGVVLTDGRIIDGNRRFTCLRHLAKKTEKFNAFEAIILDRDIEKSAKQIKLLELAIQHGEETKVEYNPIEELVGIYNDIEVTKLVSAEEYARSCNIPLKEVNHRLENAKLLNEFLEYINVPKQYYIARDLDIVSSLDTLNIILKKMHDDEEIEKTKICVFTNIIMHTGADLRAFVRDINKVANSEYFEEYIEEQLPIAEQVANLLSGSGNGNVTSITQTVRSHDDIRNNLEDSLEKVLYKTKRKETRNLPAKNISKAKGLLEDIDTNIFQKLSADEIDDVRRELNRLKFYISEIEKNLNV